MVTNHQQEVLRSCDGNVQAALVEKEAQRLFDEAFVVASDAAEDDDVFLAALEGVHGVDLQSLCKVAALLSA